MATPVFHPFSRHPPRFEPLGLEKSPARIHRTAADAFRGGQHLNTKGPTNIEEKIQNPPKTGEAKQRKETTPQTKHVRLK